MIEAFFFVSQKQFWLAGKKHQYLLQVVEDEVGNARQKIVLWAVDKNSLGLQ
jgi:hypothetical protein